MFGRVCYNIYIKKGYISFEVAGYTMYLVFLFSFLMLLVYSAQFVLYIVVRSMIRIMNVFNGLSMYISYSGNYSGLPILRVLT